MKSTSRTLFLLIPMFLVAKLASAQCGLPFHDSAKHLNPPDTMTSFFVQKLYCDTNATGYVIWVKTAIAMHYHEHHSETAIILKGRAEVKLGDKTINVRKGDIMFIPQGTHHAVKTTRGTLKIYSIQAPKFSSTPPVDRIYVH